MNKCKRNKSNLSTSSPILSQKSREFWAKRSANEIFLLYYFSR